MIQTRACLRFGLLLATIGASGSAFGAIGGLQALFAEGDILQDRNGDGVIDFIHVRIVVPAEPTPHDIAAAANFAARLAFESSGFTPGLAVRDTDIVPDRSSPPLILVGASNRWVRRLAEQGRIDLGALEPGQGMVAIVSSPFGGEDVVVVAGADPAGTAVAAGAASARLPYLWQLRSDSVAAVTDDIRGFLAERDIRVERVSARQAVYERGKEQILRLSFDVDIPRGDVRSATRQFEQLASTHVVGEADFTNRDAVRLSYYGAESLEIRIEGSDSVSLNRFGPPYRSSFPPNPWKPAVKSLDLASLYGIEGLFGDSRGEDRIPDETETMIVLGSGAGDAFAAIDLAARVALETTGISLPVAVVEDDVEDPSRLPNPILIGPGRLSAALRPPGNLEPGEGSVRIVPAAFGEFPAVVVNGGDTEGLNAATSYLARRVPYLWETRRGNVDFATIEQDVRAFFRARSTAGQAAQATLALDQLLSGLEGEELRSIDVQVFLEDETPELVPYLEKMTRDATGAAEVTVSVASRYGPVVVYDESPELGWEVDELRERLRAEVFSRVKAQDQVELEVLVSEPPELRADLEEEFRAALRSAGAGESRVRVVSAYKQGFSWLADYVLPSIKDQPVAGVRVRFPTAHYPADETWYGVPIRWLQEVFPIDEIFARELGIDIDATRFEKVDDGPIVYQVEVTDRNGSVIYSDAFAPRFTTREYFPYRPTAKIHYTTGGFQARVNGKLLADTNVRTDPERLWDFYQNEALPKMFEYATKYTGGNLGLESQPFFRQLFFEIRLSEPNFLLDLDEERISSLDSLHEDLTFDTIDFWSIFSGNSSGSRQVAPGRITPMIYPNHQGPPELRVTLKGNAVPRPRLVVKWRGARGSRGEQRLDLNDLGLESPRVTGLRVRAGQTGASEIRVSLAANSYETAATATEMVSTLGDIQEAGALRGALGYARLETLRISTELGSAALAESIRPVDRNVLSQPGDFPTITPERGKRIVTWDHVIAPAELENELIPRLRTFPEINAYVAGRTYRNRNVWAMDVMLPMEAELWSQAKASALKPVLYITTRQHSNEVSATSAALRLMELLVTDPEYRKYLERMNIVYHPMENPDGAANHYEFHQLTPSFILHGGYWSSVARDVGAYIWDPDPLLPEALVRRKLYYQWLPDVYMNPHGYPSHEWVHQFAGYKVPWFLAFWIPRGYHINLNHMDDPNYPDHKPVGRELRERIIEEVQGVDAVRAANRRLVHRFEKYARRYEPDPFRLEIYEGMNILYDHTYSFRAGDAFSREIYVSSMWKRPNPEGRSFLERHPQITVLDLGSDMPDETASPRWMETVAAPGQFGYLMSVVKLMYESQWEVQRFEEDFRDRVRLSFFRPRPVKSSRFGAVSRTLSPDE